MAHPAKPSFASLSAALQGRWQGFLEHHGIDKAYLRNTHGPCPCCGGKDRFRFDDKEGRGTWFCNQCDPQSGDGFSLLRNFLGCTDTEVLSKAAEYSGLSCQHQVPAKPPLHTKNHHYPIQDNDQKYRTARTRALAILDKANQPIEGHPYAQLKGVDLGTAIKRGKWPQKGWDDALLVPVQNPGGEITTIQAINTNGEKNFLSGGQKKGCFYPIKPFLSSHVVLIGEGLGTVGAATQGSSFPGIVAFDAANLIHVAKTIRELTGPHVILVLVADNDITQGKPNTGVIAAQKAADEVGGVVAIPELYGTKCDFWDLWKKKGDQAVKDLLTEAVNKSIDNQTETIDRPAAPALPAQPQMISSVSTTSKSEEDELEDGIPPWDGPVDIEELADSIRKTLNNHCILPVGANTALTLWIVGTYCYDAFVIFPKCCIYSPEKRCGKTTLMTVMGSLVHRQLPCSSTSPAGIFRGIDVWNPTMMIDEGDTFLNGNDEIRGIINSGHNRNMAFSVRVEGEGKHRVPRKFSTWAPMCIAMIKTPPDTIQDRSIMIPLRRKLPGEKTQKIHRNLFETLKPTRQKLRRWADDHITILADSDPVMPDVGNDRAEDNWLPLHAIAELIGGDWPQQVKSSMIQLEGTDDADSDSISQMLLADIKIIFAEKRYERLHSSDLVRCLLNMDDRPWTEWKKGRPITTSSLASELKSFGIKPRQLKVAGTNKNGYELRQFKDAFARYLPQETGSTPLQASDDGGRSNNTSSTSAPSVESNNTASPFNDAACREVDPKSGDNDDDWECISI